MEFLNFKSSKNMCTQMAIYLSTEMKTENKNCNIAISIYIPKLKRRNLTPTYQFLFFSFKLRGNKMLNSFLMVFIFKFVNCLMVNDY